jgi:pectate lyase
MQTVERAAQRRGGRLKVPLIVAFVVALLGAFTAVAVTPASAATIDAGDWYVIVNRNSGKVIDVAGTSTDDGALIQQWSRNDGYWQQFRFESAGTGWWRIIARHSGKAIDLWEWNTADGADFRQWPITSGYNQQFSVINNGDGYLRFINRWSGKAMEVWEWSTADGGRVSQFADLNGANQQWQLIKVDTGSGGGGGGGGGSTGMIGWATQGGGTTGGSGGGTVTVTSLSALTSAASSSTTQTILVNGNFPCSDDVRVASNKTIQGVGSSSGLTGCGLNMRQVSNVIVRNMKISKVLAGNGNGDAIHVDNSTRLWIDHNDLSSDTTHGTDYYDGLIDITHGADYITVSWNKVHDHIKCMLLGHSDSNAAEDTGHLRVTYHHNYFSNCAQRSPRVRFGNPVHVFNNYYTQSTSFSYAYGVATTCNAGVLVEGDYFENIADPTHVGEGSSPDGNLVARNNYFSNSGTPQTNGSVASIPYSYTLDAASSVKSIVTSGAGTGKI